MVKRRKHWKGPKEQFSFVRHILPPLLGVGSMVLVLLLLNMQWIMAQYRYHYQKPSQTVVAQQVAQATATPPADAPPGLAIPSLNINAPIVFEPRTDEGGIQLALRNGVVHYATTAMPGQKGNVVIFGHSSGQAWAPGNYKFVFTLLDKLKRNDLVTIGYQGKRYVYVVTDTTVVPPTDLSVLQPIADDPTLTLITCTPVGTSKNRLVVHARQIDPNPQTASQSTGTTEQPLNRLPN